MSNVAGRSVFALWQYVTMRRVIMVYAALTFVVAGDAVFRAGPWSGLCAIFAPLLMGIAVGGLKAMFFWGDRNQKIVGAGTGLLLGAFAVRLAPGFSVHVLGYSFGGPAWTVVAGFLAFFASNRANWEAVR